MLYFSHANYFNNGQITLFATFNTLSQLLNIAKNLKTLLTSFPKTLNLAKVKGLKKPIPNLP